MAKTEKNRKPKITKKIAGFFKDILSELKKVVWPTKKQLINNTITVLVVCFLIGGIIWLFDWGIGALVKATLLK